MDQEEIFVGNVKVEDEIFMKYIVQNLPYL